MGFSVLTDSRYNSWSAPTYEETVIYIDYTNQTSKTQTIKSLTCQLGSGKGTVAAIRTGTKYTGNGSSLIARLYIVNPNNAKDKSNWKAEQWVTGTVAVENVGTSATGGWFKNIGGNFAYNVTFYFNLDVASGETIHFGIYPPAQEGKILTSRYTYDKNYTLYQVVTGDVVDKEVNPTSIVIDSGESRITDVSGAISGAGLKLTPLTTLGLTAYPDNCVLTSLVASGNKVNVSTNITGTRTANITVTANSIVNEYNSSTTVTATANGGATANATIRFANRVIQKTLNENTLSLNILQASKRVYEGNNLFFEISDSQTIYDQIKNIVFRDSFGSGNYKDFLIKNKDSKKYLALNENNSGLSLNQDSSFLNIENENKPVKLYWNIYNDDVQEKTSTVNEGNYKNTLETTLTYSITPNLESLFTYRWLDDKGKEVDNLPDMFLPRQQAFPLDLELTYDDSDPYGGYCRGFRIEVLDSSTMITKAEVEQNKDVNDKDTTTFTFSDFFNNTIIKNLTTGYYKIRLSTYFYFNNDVNKKYYGTNILLPQEFLIISDEEILPELCFPSLATKIPYTHMMLTSAERFGYIYNPILCDNQSKLSAKIGFMLNDNIDCKLEDNVKYFSSNVITNHLVFNIGKFVEDNYNNLSDTDYNYFDIYKYGSRGTLTSIEYIKNNNDGTLTIGNGNKWYNTSFTKLDTVCPDLDYGEYYLEIESDQLAPSKDLFLTTASKRWFSGTNYVIDNETKRTSYTAFHANQDTAVKGYFPPVTIKGIKITASGPNLLSIKPYVDLYYDTEFIKRIQIADNPKDKVINAIVNISKSGFWVDWSNELEEDTHPKSRPRIEQGNIIQAVSFNGEKDKCETFINKYRYLAEDLVELPDISSGTLINTDFWTTIADQVLAQYAINMQKWATNITNFIVLWAIPEFKHKKGEIITNNNLYQNYWDLLYQYSGADVAFTVYGEEDGSPMPALRVYNDGKTPVKFTHNELHNYKHNEITNKFRKEE